MGALVSFNLLANTPKNINFNIWGEVRHLGQLVKNQELVLDLDLKSPAIEGGRLSLAKKTVIKTDEFGQFKLNVGNAFSYYDNKSVLAPVGLEEFNRSFKIRGEVSFINQADVELKASREKFYKLKKEARTLAGGSISTCQDYVKTELKIEELDGVISKIQEFNPEKCVMNCYLSSNKDSKVERACIRTCQKTSVANRSTLRNSRLLQKKLKSVSQKLGGEISNQCYENIETLKNIQFVLPALSHKIAYYEQEASKVVKAKVELNSFYDNLESFEAKDKSGRLDMSINLFPDFK